VLFQIGLHCFLDGQVWNQLVLLQRLSRHRVEIANLKHQENGKVNGCAELSFL